MRASFPDGAPAVAAATDVCASPSSRGGVDVERFWRAISSCFSSSFGAGSVPKDDVCTRLKRRKTFAGVPTTCRTTQACKEKAGKRAERQRRRGRRTQRWFALGPELLGDKSPIKSNRCAALVMMRSQRFHLGTRPGARGNRVTHRLSRGRGRVIGRGERTQ